MINETRVYITRVYITSVYIIGIYIIMIDKRIISLEKNVEIIENYRRYIVEENRESFTIL